MRQTGAVIFGHGSPARSKLERVQRDASDQQSKAWSAAETVQQTMRKAPLAFVEVLSVLQHNDTWTQSFEHIEQKRFHLIELSSGLGAQQVFIRSSSRR